MTARLFVGAVARQFEVADETVEDLKLAVSEACTSALRRAERAAETGPVRVHAQAERSSLSFEVEGAVGEDEIRVGTTEDFVRSLGLEVVEALFPDLQVVTSPDGASNLRVAVAIGPGDGDV